MNIFVNHTRKSKGFRGWGGPWEGIVGLNRSVRDTNADNQNEYIVFR